MRSKIKNRILVVLSILLIISFSVVFFQFYKPVSADESSVVLVEEYTNSDYLYGDSSKTIQDYKNEYYQSTSTIASGLTATATGDDPIVKIVPKEYFFLEDCTVYIGREYGFFITERDENQTVTVFVFDIITTTDVANPATASQITVTIVPLFQYDYFVLSSENDYYIPTFFMNCDYSGGEDFLIIPRPSSNFIYEETTKYFIKDVTFGGSLMNQQHYNQYDELFYDGNEDLGSFFIRSQFEYKGVGKEKSGLENLVPYLDFMVGMVSPFLGGTPGAIMDVLSMIAAGVENAPEMVEDTRTTVHYEELYMQCTFTSKKEQIDNNGYLNKDMFNKFSSTEADPVMFGRTTGTDYIRCNFTLGETEDWYTSFIRTLSLNIVTQDTDFVGNSTVTEYAKSSNCHIYDVREPEIKELKFKGNTEYGYTLFEGKDYYHFMPNYSGKYILNFGATNNVVIKNGNQILDVDQIGSNYYADLVENENYQFEISCKDTSSVGNYFNPIVEVSDDLSNCQVSANGRYLIKYSPAAAGVLKIESDNVNNDLIILDDSLIKVAESNSNILHFVAEKEDYYILVENTTNKQQLFSISINNPSAIDTETEKEVDLTENMVYYAFNVDEGYYTLSYYNYGNGSVITEVVPPSMVQDEKSIDDCNLIDIYVPNKQTFYFGLKGEGSVTFKLVPSDNAYQWEVNGELIDGNEISLERGSSTLIRLKVGEFYFDGYIYKSINEAGYTYNSTQKTLIIDSNCQLTNDEQTNQIGLMVAIDTNKLVTLSINVIYEKTPTFKFYSDQNGFGLEYSAITSVANESAEILLKLNLMPQIHSVTITLNPTKAQSAGKYDLTSKINSLQYTAYTNFIVTVEQVVITGAGGITTISCTNSLAMNYLSVPEIEMNRYFGGGQGYSSSPFEIDCFRHLNNIRYAIGYSFEGMIQVPRITAAFILTQDIVAQGNWTPIDTPFIGDFEGNHYEIKNLRIIISASEYEYDFQSFGLFSDIAAGGEIRNLELSSVMIEGSNYNGSKYILAGAIAGSNGGTIENCEVDGTISVHRIKAWCGGIVGHNVMGDILSCTSRITIIGYGELGGIAGLSSFGSTISNCTNYGLIEYYLQSESFGTNNVGGIVGRNSEKVSNCRNYGTIRYATANSTSRTLRPCMGQIVGYQESGGTVSGCSALGTLDKGSLHIEKWTTGALWWKEEHSWDQAQCVNTTIGYQA